MSNLVEDHDWSVTALGSREEWPDCLRHSAEFCLDAPFPVALWWGPELVQLHNDAFRAAIGLERHRSSFAASLARGWQDCLTLFEPAVTRILTGETGLRLDPHFLLDPDRQQGMPAFFEMSLSPVKNDDGKVAGVLAAFAEAIPGATVQEEQAFQIALSSATRGMEDPEKLAAAACEMAGLRLNLSALCIIETGDSGGTAWPGWPADAWPEGRPQFQWQDLNGSAALLQRGEPCSLPWKGRARDPLAVPLRKNGRLLGFLLAEQASVRDWDRAGIRMLQAVLEHFYAELEPVRMRAAERDEAQRMRAALSIAPALLWSSRPHGEWVWSAPCWTEFTGLSPGDSLGQGWLDAVHPDDSERMRAVWDQTAPGEPLHARARLRNSEDGDFRWFQIDAAPARADMAQGDPQWFGACTDIDPLFQEDARRGQALAELQRRERATFALLRSVARRSAEVSQTADELAMDLDGRIEALARVQAILTRAPGGEVGLDFVVAEELGAHGAHEDGIIKLNGPDIRLKLSAAQAIALAVHELVVAAVTQGALTLDKDGKIRIRWQVENTARGPELAFSWDEKRGFPGASDGRERASFTLLEKTLADMHAQTSLEVKPEGFTCRILVPLAEGSFRLADEDSIRPAD